MNTNSEWNLQTLIATMITAWAKNKDIRGYLIDQLKKRKHPKVRQAVFAELEKRIRMN